MYKTNGQKKMRSTLVKNSPMAIATALYVIVFIAHIY